MSNHLIILSALLCEARPVIERYRLKKDFDYKKFDVFRNENIFLIISGIGRLKAAVAATYILNRVNSHSSILMLNLGIAGSTHIEHGIGHSFLVNKIIDTNTDRAYYPDILYKHKLPEIQIATFDKIVTDRETTGDYSGLVDMEAAGFAAAALTFLGPHQIALMKIVSDHLEVDHLTAESVSELVKSELPAITGLIDSLQNLDLKSREMGIRPEQAVIDALVDGLHLTSAQEKILIDDLFGCHLKYGEIPSGWEKFLGQPPETKADRNRRFAELRKFLHGE